MKNKVLPVWYNFPAVFLYGLRWQPLVLAVLIPILVVLSGRGIVGWAVFAILYAMLFKYAFVALQRTAEGGMTPPPLDDHVLADEYALPLKLYLVFILFVLAVPSVGDSIGSFASGFLFVFGHLVFPAVVMLLAMTESFLNAVNPVLLLRLIIDLGWSYFALMIFISLLETAQANISIFLLGEAYSPINHPVMLVLTVYYTIITFHLMGYILYQKQEVLGQRVSVDRQAPVILDQRLSHFQNMIDQGHYDAAIAELQGLLKSSPADLDIRHRLHQLLVLEQKTDDLARHSRRYLPLLLGAVQTSRTLDVYRDCVRLGVDCSFDTLDDYYRLAQLLNNAGKYKDVVKLLSGLHKRFPNSDLIAPVYLLNAQILCEKFNQDTLAIKILKYLLENHRHHPLVPEIEKYKHALEKLV